jgi:glutaredoxin-dependent peroxiredoxin
MSIQVGSKAPAFNLVSTDKEQVSLDSFKGQNLVILFFPFAFTSVCTAELCSMRDNLSVYNNLHTAVVGISVDSPFTLGKFKEDQKLNFPLLSDFNKQAAPAYGAFYDSFSLGLQGVARRAAFVVDKEGVIRYAEVLENAGNLPDFEAIKKTLEGLQ